MPRVTLQPDSDDEHVWLALDGRRLVPLRVGDQEGLKIILTLLVENGAISTEEAATVQGVTPRTVEAARATYAATASSVDLVDRRHFNPGQQTAYRMEPHKPALVRQATLNLLRGQQNSERRLAEQLGHVVDDRTVGRHLHDMGWREAEEAGLAEEVTAYLNAERLRAYWAGVAGEPLEKAVNGSRPDEWQTPQRGLVGAALGVAHLILNGAYEGLKRLVVAPLPVLSQWPPLRVWHTLLVYLLVSGGARLSQAKHFAWRQVQGLLTGCAGLSATSLRHWLVAVAQQAEEKVTVCRSDGQEESITRRWLLNQPGEFMRHKTERIILSVADRFEDRRMQAAYEHYCVILNQRDIRVPMDDGKPWHLLFTYHLDAPSSSVPCWKIISCSAPNIR